MGKIRTYSGCSPIYPVLKAKKQKCKCPPGRRGPAGPTGPTGPAGPEGPPGESGTGSTFFTTQANDPVNLLTSSPIVMDLPPLTTSEGQQIKLDSTFRLFFSTGSVTNYSLNVNYQLVRLGTSPTTLTTAPVIRTRTFSSNTTTSDTFTPNITWIDTPPPGTHTYRIIITRVTATNITTLQVTNRALNAVAQITVDPFNIYVRAGEVDGDGSQENPFGTIQEGIAAVATTGTVHILEGTYPVVSQINVNKQGITLLGYPGNMIVLQAPVNPFLVTGNAITLEGLTMTSDIPYPREFIQIGGSDHRIVNNTIYGPEQAPPSSGWVTNRAIVTQANNMTNLLIEGNTFHSLRQPAYLNPNTTGDIINNVVYNTRGWVVDRAVFVFSGNSWGIPENFVDIALLAGTQAGPPYDPLSELSDNNSDATIDDQR
ncbi:hypothetical protein [Halobacillus seohaensis]|uniref:Uncharacterized protein n=1 Tax=Halobacillus seohaensis TaxID=447421 RepID=A0ABW2ESW4_9BACI